MFVGHFSTPKFNQRVYIFKHLKFINMKIIQNFLAGMITASLVCMLIYALTSCKTGYGCNGRSKTMTGFKQDKYGNMYGRHMGLTRKERRNY